MENKEISSKRQNDGSELEEETKGRGKKKKTIKVSMYIF